MEQPQITEVERDRTPSGETPLPFTRLEETLIALLAGGDSGAIEMVDAALAQAVAHRASDVHIEPWDDCLSLRFRIDGILHEAASLPRKHHGQVLGRIKVLARIITYQKDIPQDGRIDPEATPCGKGMRVATFPTVYGEKAVIRLMNTDPALFSVGALGFQPDVVEALRSFVTRPQGTLLLTGPASSGKTTTIYALLSELLALHAPSAHVVTIEDPVEYRLGRVAQTQVNPHAGFTFEAALRAALRQDPEVIMVGEIRDPETARTAIQAGLTGHLVISTIHSGTAAGVFTRLLDMGIEPYLVASSVTGVLAQRLVRRNCPHCTETYIPDPEDKARFGVNEPGTSFRRGAGCEACQGIGYQGRLAVGEMLQVDERMEDLVLARSRTHVLHDAALAHGMRPLAVDAAQRVRAGKTTVEELKRVLLPSSPPAAKAPVVDEAIEPAASCSPGLAESHPRRNGFALIELMAALFIVAVGLMGTITLFHFGIGRLQTMREIALATRLVQNEVETLRSLPYESLTDCDEGAFTTSAPELEDLFRSKAFITVEPHGDASLELKEVTATIRWTGEHGRHMEKYATTLIANKGQS